MPIWLSIMPICWLNLVIVLRKFLCVTTDIRSTNNARHSKYMSSFTIDEIGVPNGFENESLDFPNLVPACTFATKLINWHLVFALI